MDTVKPPTARGDLYDDTPGVGQCYVGGHENDHHKSSQYVDLYVQNPDVAESIADIAGGLTALDTVCGDKLVDSLVAYKKSCMPNSRRTLLDRGLGDCDIKFVNTIIHRGTFLPNIRTSESITILDLENSVFLGDDGGFYESIKVAKQDLTVRDITVSFLFLSREFPEIVDIFSGYWDAMTGLKGFSPLSKEELLWFENNSQNIKYMLLESYASNVVTKLAARSDMVTMEEGFERLRDAMLKNMSHVKLPPGLNFDDKMQSTLKDRIDENKGWIMEAVLDDADLEVRQALCRFGGGAVFTSELEYQDLIKWLVYGKEKAGYDTDAVNQALNNIEEWRAVTHKVLGFADWNISAWDIANDLLDDRQRCLVNIRAYRDDLSQLLETLNSTKDADIDDPEFFARIAGFLYKTVIELKGYSSGDGYYSEGDVAGLKEHLKMAINDSGGLIPEFDVEELFEIASK